MSTHTASNGAAAPAPVLALDAVDPGTPVAGLVLPPGVQDQDDKTRKNLGVIGRPLDRRAPFYVGLTGGLGLGAAYVIGLAIGDITSVLVLIGLGLFIAVGLNPILVFLVHRGLSRGLAVAIVTLSFAIAVGAFVFAAVPPVSHELLALVTNYPRYKAELASGRGWAGNLVARLHLTSYFRGKSKLDLTSMTGGVLGAGKLVLSLGVATVSVVVLTVYFFIALPGVKRLWLSLVPISRRQRVELLTEEVFDRVGGFMLGNLLTSAGGRDRHLHLAERLRRPLCAAPGPVRGPVRPDPYGGLDHRRRGGHRRGADQGLPGRHRHRRLLRRVPPPRGLPPEPEGHEAHRKGEPGPDHHRHPDRWHPARSDRSLVAIPAAATIELLLQEVAFPRQNQR